jgi:hypothetical protein
MDERVHSMFRNEMSAQARPPLDGLAQEVLARGRRARRARTAKIASGVAVMASLVGVVVAMPAIAGSHSVSTGRGAVTKSAGSRPVSTGQGTAAKPASPASSHTPGAQTSFTKGASAGLQAVLLSTASPVNYIPQPPGPKAPTSAGAVLDELLKLLPPGATSNYALYNEGSEDLGAQTYLAGASGVGMIRIHLASGSLNPDACDGALPSDLTMTCGTLPDGAPVTVAKISDNCIQSASIDVDHGRGTVVQIDLATCLAWNGTSNPPSPMAITIAQAEQIAANPAWGIAEMDAALVQDAATRFSAVPAGS